MAFSRCCRAILLCLLLLPASKLAAEQKTALGNWDVHYIALNSTFITPDIATHYGLVRSKYNGLINITVLDKNSQKAQTVKLQGQAQNLLGVVKPLNFKQIKEGDAVYYLASLAFSDREHYRINITIGEGKTEQHLKFEHTFYVE